MMAIFNHVKGESDRGYVPAKVVTPGLRVPPWLYFPWLFLKAFVFVLFYACLALIGYVRFAWATVPLTVLVYVGFAYEAWVLAVTVAVCAGAFGVWWWQARASFWRWVGWFYIAQFNRYVTYSRLWQGICTNLRLATAFDGDKYFPRIVKVRRDAEGDILTVQMLGGQHPADWMQHASRFAFAYNALSCTVKMAPAKRFARNRIQIHLRTKDALAKTIAPFAVPAVPDVSKLVIALRSSGKKVTVSIRTHLLIAGASKAGKGSVLWAIISALAAGVRQGLVRIYGFDPKGGVEFGLGEALFDKFFYGEPDTMADALEDIVKELKGRQARQKSRKERDHVATTESPSLVVMVDEFGALTGYVGDRKVKERISNAMSLILSQGRATGIYVVAALQDPRKEILPFRNLFFTRIALRLNEESEVAMILTDDAADMGASCHEIPDTLPGIGYMILPDVPQPERIRFPFHSDADIEALADAYATEPDTAITIPAQQSTPMLRVNR